MSGGPDEAEVEAMSRLLEAVEDSVIRELARIHAGECPPSPAA